MKAQKEKLLASYQVKKVNKAIESLMKGLMKKDKWRSWKLKNNQWREGEVQLK